MKSRAVVFVSLAVVSLAACTYEIASDTTSGGSGGGAHGSADGGVPWSDNPPPPHSDAGPVAFDASASGLPCDVAAVLAKDCLSCHGATPSGGAPMSLVTYAELTAPSKSNPSLSFAAESVQRMQNTSSPMPPSGLPAAADVKVMSDWVSAGTPMGTCGGADAGPDPFATPSVCTNGMNKSPHQEGSAMAPGEDCMSCHSSGKIDPDKVWEVAGTVYPNGHAPSDCYGTKTGNLSVVITDKNGQVVEAPVNAAGNFYVRSVDTTIARPYSAYVKNGTTMATRAMGAKQSEGGCNACHTESGAMGAPGRILEP